MYIKRRSVIALFLLMCCVGGFYLITSASAQGMKVGRSENTATDIAPDDDADESTKNLNRGKELFIRREGSEPLSPFLQTPNRLQKQTNLKPKDFVMPESWGLLDVTSRNIKKAETLNALKSQRELMGRIDALNVKETEETEKRIANQRADEKATQNRKPERMTPQEAKKAAADMKAGKKQKSSSNKSVIKRAKDPNNGKPRKLFNSPND